MPGNCSNSCISHESFKNRPCLVGIGSDDDTKTGSAEDAATKKMSAAAAMTLSSASLSAFACLQRVARAFPPTDLHEGCHVWRVPSWTTIADLLRALAQPSQHAAAGAFLGVGAGIGGDDAVWVRGHMLALQALLTMLWSDLHRHRAMGSTDTSTSEVGRLLLKTTVCPLRALRNTCTLVLQIWQRHSAARAPPRNGGSTGNVEELLTPAERMQLCLLSSEVLHIAIAAAGTGTGIKDSVGAMVANVHLHQGPLREAAGCQRTKHRRRAGLCKV